MFTQKKYWPFFMWLLPLTFFTYQFILRLWPGLMMNQILGQFSIDATQFGVLASVYYYGYAGMQIPTALLLDRFSTRHIVFVFAVLCGVAAFLFTYTSNWYIAALSRFLIGAGSAVGFLGVSKVVSQWFPKHQYARMIGFSFTIGLMGAIYGGKPISLLIETYSGQTVAFTLAVVSIVIAASTYFFLRSPQTTQIEAEHSQSLKLSDLKSLLASPIIWFLAFANFLMVGALEGFADVWGVSYLMTAYALTKSDAAQLVSFIFIGMLFGGPLLAFLSKRLGKYTVIALCGLGIVFAFICLLSEIIFQPYLLSVLFFCIGIMCCYQVIVFAAGSDLVNLRQLGITIAFLNCINMLGGSFFHTVIGYIMDAYWTGETTQEGIRQYTQESYGFALSVIPICAILGVFIICLIELQMRRK